jgi:NADPH2:quinone reductase
VKAIVLREVDGDLAVEEVAEPEGDPVLDVRAAGINFLDVRTRRGRYPQMPELPHVLGAEVAGDLGGRRVVSLTRRGGGGYAERVAVDPDWTFELPSDASYAEGASFLMTYLTAYIAIELQARVTKGMNVLVHAGSGGVGSAAIQLAKRRGARVIATASTDEKLAFARAQGADEVLSYDGFDEVKVETVIDPVGGAVFARSLRVLEPLGSIVAIGFAGGMWDEVSPAFLVGRNVTVHGLYLGRLMQLRPELVRESARAVLALWIAGDVKPAVGATFPLDRANDAHALIEQRRHVGKVVLEP